MLQPKDVPFMFTLCAFQALVELRPCANFPLHLARVESLAFMIHGNNQGCGSDACNIKLLAHNDDHVHQPLGDH